MSVTKEFSKDTLIYGFGSAVKKFIGVFLLPFYTRSLLPEDFGILDTLGTCIFFVSTILNIGIDSAVGYYYFTCEDEKEKGKILYTTFILRILTIIPVLILSIFSNQISISLFNSDKYAWPIFVTCMIIPLTLITSEQEFIYRIFRKPWKFNLITILKSLFSITGGIILVIYLRKGVLGAQLASLISSALVILYSFITFTKHQYNYHFSWIWAKKLMQYGYPLIWAGLASWLFVGADRFFLLHFKDLTDIGYYSIGNTFSQPINLINTAVQMSYGALIFSIFSRDKTIDKTETKDAAIESLRIYLIIALMTALFLSVFSYNILSIVTTKKYLPGALAIPFLAFSAIASQCVQLTSIGLFLNKKNWHYTFLLIVAAIVNIILNLFFIPKYSYFGASFTVFFSNFLYFILILHYSNKFFKVPYSYIKIFVPFFILLFISLIIPLCEIHYLIKIAVIYKCIIFLIGCTIPVIFGLLKSSDIKKILSMLRLVK